MRDGLHPPSSGAGAAAQAPFYASNGTPFLVLKRSFSVTTTNASTELPRHERYARMK